MAIQRVGGYVYSCSACAVVYPVRASYGRAAQDDWDHLRVVPEDACRCRLIDGRRHHTPVCASSVRLPVAAPSEPTSGTATS